MSGIYTEICDLKAKNKKCFAVLIDPDKVSDREVDRLIALGIEARVDYFFVGGSLVLSGYLEDCVQRIKKNCKIPVLLFPGSPSQITPKADALLYLSLISGRNPELLIGQHVVSAPQVKRSGLEVISTGYMVIDGGAATTVSYISHASPLPADKPDIALCTALAGEMLGMKIIYMDAGSGARRPVSEEMITQVSSHISIPLIVGGGITDPEKAYLDSRAGADIVVVGNAIEKDTSLIAEIAAAIHSVSVTGMV